MAESCVFCCATPVDIDMEDVWGTEKSAAALSRICSLNLVAPPLVFEPGYGMWVCATCRPTIHAVIKSLRSEEYFLTKLANLNVQIVGGVEALGRRVIVGTSSPNPVSHSDTNHVWKEYRRQVVRNYVTGKLPNPSVHLVPLDLPAANSSEEDDADDDNLLAGDANQDLARRGQEAEEVVIRGMGRSPCLDHEEKTLRARKEESLGRIQYLLLDNNVDASIRAQNLAADLHQDNFNDSDDGSSGSSGSSDLENIFVVKRIVRRKKVKAATENVDDTQEPETSETAVKTARPPIRPGYGRLSRGRGKASRRTGSTRRIESPPMTRLATPSPSPSPPPIKRGRGNGRGGRRGRGRRVGGANRGLVTAKVVPGSDDELEAGESSQRGTSELRGSAIPPPSPTITSAVPKPVLVRNSPPLVPPPAPLNRPPKKNLRGRKRPILENLQTKSHPPATEPLEPGNESLTDDDDNSAAATTISFVPSSPPKKKKKYKALPVMGKKRYSGPYTPHYGTQNTTEEVPPPVTPLFTCPVDNCGESFTFFDPLLTSHFFTYHITLAAKVSKKEHAFKCKLCVEKDFFVKLNLAEIREANRDDAAGKEMAKHYLEEHQVGFKTLAATEATTGVKSTAKRSKKTKRRVKKVTQTKDPVLVPVITSTLSPPTSEQENVPKSKEKKKKKILLAKESESNASPASTLTKAEKTVTKKSTRKKKTALTPSTQGGDGDEEEAHEFRPVVKKRKSTRKAAAPKRKVGRKKKDLKTKQSLEQMSNSGVIDDDEEEKDPHLEQSFEVESHVIENEESPREEQREVVFNEEEENLNSEPSQSKPIAKPRPETEEDLNLGSFTRKRKPGPKSKTTQQQKSPSPRPLLVPDERTEVAQTKDLIPSTPSPQSSNFLQNGNQDNREEEEEKDETDGAANEQADDDTVETPAVDDEEYQNLLVKKIKKEMKRDTSVLAEPIASDEEYEKDDEDNYDDDINNRIMIEMSEMFEAEVASDPSKPFSVSVPIPETPAAGLSSAAARTGSREGTSAGSPEREGTSGVLAEVTSPGPAEGSGAESGGDADTEGGEDSFKDAESGELPSAFMYTMSFIK